MATPLRSTATSRPFPSPWGAGTLGACPALGGRHSWCLPSPWGQALLVLAQPLGGRPSWYLPSPLGCPFILPCLPPCVVTFVNAFHVEQYICKCLQVQPLTNVNASSIGWFTFVYRPINQAVMAHLYAITLLFLCSPFTFVNACRCNYPPVISICQCLQVQLSACRLHLSTACPAIGQLPLPHRVSRWPAAAAPQGQPLASCRCPTGSAVGQLPLPNHRPCHRASCG